MNVWKTRLPKRLHTFMENFFGSADSKPLTEMENYMNYVRDIRLYGLTNNVYRQKKHQLVRAFHDITGWKPENQVLHDSIDETMRRYPRITSHLIAESMGYATPTNAARIVRDAKYNQKNWSRWIYSCYDRKKNCERLPKIWTAL